MWMWAAVFGLGALYVGSTLPTPLYPVYRREFGFSELMVTAIYASYVIGNLAVLFAFGRISDQLGRRPTTLAAFAVLIASAVCFLFATSTPWLFIARVLNGLAAGLGAGALTAWIAELEVRHNQARAALVACAGNLGGLCVGAIVAGVLAEYAPWPLRISYVVYVGALIIMIVLLRIAPEGVKRIVRDPDELSLRPRFGVPREIRMAFIAPAAMAFSVFALGGFFAALTPGLLAQNLDQRNLAVVGALVALFFGFGAVTAVVTGKLRPRPAMLSATAALLIGLALLIIAEHQRSMKLLGLATVISGAAMAIGYRCSLAVVNEITPEARRAEVVSSYLFMCYTGNSLPVIGVGLLSVVAGPATAHLTFAILLGALGIVACAAGWRYLPRH
jgi:MFS family permease